MKNTESIPHPTYSVIVPCYNRQDEIQELLQSFLAIKFDPRRLELIIADDGSSDNTCQIVESLCSRFPYPLHFFSQTNQGPGAARNLGMEKARGDFFIFIDSDCTVPEDWLQQIDKRLSEQPADAFGGRDSFRSDFPDLLKAINYSMTSFITTGGLRGRKGKKLAKFYPRSFNMGLSRQLYQKIGGFGSLRHGQDIEYSRRMIKSGARIIYINEAVVYHKRRTSLKKFFRQVFNWGVARINLYRIDPGMLEPLHAAPAAVTLGFVLLVLGSILFGPVWLTARWLFGLALAVLFISGVHAALKYRSPAMLYRFILGKPEFTGFKKKYYH
jgi:glycosyltransferase involved in cell wall biosynthesis